jgi:hypothetical protein
MLSGVKTGKKKRKVRREEPAGKAPATSSSSSNNEIAAERLRRSLAESTSTALSGTCHRSSDHTDSGEVSSRALPHELLERSGRIQQQQNEGEGIADEASAVVVDMPAASSRAAKLVIGENNTEFAQKMSMDEELARNVVRLGKKRRYKMKSSVDSDEEEHRLLSMMVPQEPKKSNRHSDPAEKALHRDRSRELALNDRQEQAVAKCWWWLESPSFQTNRLLSLGNYVSLVMAPLNLSLKSGHHFFLVPIKFAESLASCENDVWDEVVRYQTSLRNMYEKEYNQGVLFCETVLPTKKFRQTRLEVLPVKKKAWQDAELYFNSSLTEKADEFGGTHTKILRTKGKGLRRTVPANFPYFYIEWDADSEGYAQIIESSDFQADYGVETVAAMCGLDPIRFQRKKKFSAEQEKECILDFLEKWKQYDWTAQLDG